MSEVSISRGNTKMGDIQSVSLPAIVTCRVCDCHTKCYAHRLERLRPNVANAYQRNLEILQSDPDIYWREVEAAIMLSRFFRFHVSGDIPDADYFAHMVEIAKRNQHCEILCFTKKYELINDYIGNAYLESFYSTSLHPQFFNMWTIAEDVLPPNLHIVMSAWNGLEMQNPYELPEAHVRYRDGTTTGNLDATECNGNCMECAITEGGCWMLKHGQQVIFNEH